MEKTYTNEEYVALAQEANAEGKVVFKLQHEISRPVRIYEFEEIDGKQVPVMHEETITDPITGEETAIMVQSCHLGTEQVEVEEIVKEYDGYYICMYDNVTDGTLNPDFEEQQAAKERARINALSKTKREIFLAIYRDKGVTPEVIRNQLTTDEAKIEFDYAEKYYRGNPLIEQLGTALGYTSEELDVLFGAYGDDEELTNYV